MRYVLLLRGINVGGNMVKMARLKQMLEELGYQQVVTLLNSGNVVFTTEKRSSKALRTEIENKLEETFGFPVHTILLSHTAITALVSSDPFNAIPVTKDTRLYVTFLSEKPSSTLKLPYTSEDNSFRILSVTSSEICSVLDLSLGKGTTDAMQILERAFGRQITTRNWNTIQKIAAL